MRFEKILSGGQTGVDRAALDVAHACHLPCGGWCPKGRTAEDGTLPDRYPLKETPLADYGQRTEWNVRDADGTLILTMGQPTGGTAQTIEHAKSLHKPHLVVDLLQDISLPAMTTWAQTHQITILNIAGPRESKSPGVYELASQCLRLFFGAGVS